MSISPVFGHLTAAVKGISSANIINIYKIKEDSTRQGRNHVLTALLQIPQTYTAFSIAQKAISVASQARRSFPSQLGWSCWIVPIAIACAARQGVSNLKLRYVINFAQAHITTLSNIVTIVSLIALFILGNYVYASVSLAWLGLGLLARSQILPKRIRTFIFHSSFWVGDLAALAVGDLFSKCIAIIDITMRIGNLWMHRNTNLAILRSSKNSQSKITNRESGLSVQDFKKITDKTEMKLNLSHLNENLIPPIPTTVSISDLKNLCESFSWEDHLKALQVKLKGDARWKEFGQPDQEIAYVKKMFSKFIDSVVKKKIKQGEPTSYALLEGYLKFIAYQLPLEKDKKTQADILMALAIEGGDYCGAAKVRVATECFSSLIGTANISLKQRILILLEAERRRQFDIIYHSFWDLNPLLKAKAWLTDSQDIHGYNQFINITGGKFGLMMYNAAAQDPTAVASPLEKYIFAKLSFKLRDIFWKGGKISKYVLKRAPGIPKWHFWRYRIIKQIIDIPGYNAKTIENIIHNAEGTTLPKREIYQYWENWIKRQNLPKDEEEDRIDKLQNDITPTLYGDCIEQDVWTTLPNGAKKYSKTVLTSKLCKALLAEIGIINS